MRRVTRRKIETAARRRQAIHAAVVFAAALSAAAPGEASAQGPSGSYLDARERAERDWEVMTQSADALWAKTEDIAAEIGGHPAASAAALALAAALGGFIGARGRRFPAPPTAPPSPPPPSRPARPRQERDDPSGSANVASGQRYQVSAPPRDEDEDGTRLFDFLEQRFGLTDRRADTAISYFERLSAGIDKLKREAADAKSEAAATSAAPAAGDDAEAACWRMIGDGVRLGRGALQSRRDADPEVAAFDRVIGLDDALRRLASLRTESDGRAVDPGVIDEAWPHALFRAEALLTSYYPGHGVWGDLREGAALSAAAFRRLLRSRGVAVAGLRLLCPHDPADGEEWSDAAEGLSDLAHVRRRLRTLGRADRPWVIDCESVGFRDSGRGVSTRSRLILHNPDEWAAL